eukprot:XP_011662978.1 PREDICTED: uncharacterized protein LOC105437731 [Strongylocentrotus purpuratus]
MASAITNTEIEDLAKGIGINNKIDGLGLKLGYEYAEIDIYKASNYSGATVTHQGTKQMLRDWRDGISQEEQQRPILKKALKDAGLARLAEKYLGGEAVTDSGQAGRSGTETHPVPVTVHQSGGAQTINACGPVTNLTIHNHPTK